MAERAVDLVIRAKNQTAGAFKGVQKTLDDLMAALEAARRSSRDLGAGFDRAERGAAAFGSALASAGGGADKVKAAYDRVSAAVDGARKKFSEQEAQVREAEAAYRALQAQANSAAKVLASMRARVGPFEPEFNERLAAAERGYNSLANEVRRAGKDLGAQQEQLAQSSQELSRVESAAAAAEAALRSLNQTGRAAAAQRAAENAKANAAARAGMAALNARERGLDAAAARREMQQANDAARAGLLRLAAAEKVIAERVEARRRAVAEAAAERKRANESAKAGLSALAQREAEIAQAIRRRALEERRAAVEAAKRAREFRNPSRPVGGVAGLAEAEKRVEQAIRERAAATEAAREAYRRGNENARAGLAALAAAERQIGARLAANAARSRAAAMAAAAQDRQLNAALRGGVSNLQHYADLARRAAVEIARFGRATRYTAAGLTSANRGFNGFRAALAAFYGDSRRALSLMQRLRGEILSLTASAVGFYGMFRTGQGFLDSFLALERAQNRLGAAFKQNTGLVGNELAYLREEAHRLGMSFETLSDTYSKFLVSGKEAGLSVAELRTIFRQVSEAGRVLGLSNDQVSRTFVALSQIAGKGVAGMEEIRQQIGDQIPGAVGILAKALGYTEDNMGEFFKRVENGALDSRTALLALGQGLEDRFGDQLQGKLDGVEAKLGRLMDTLFKRKVTAANAGFIAGLETALAALDEFLSSEQGIEFFEKLGAAFGSLFELLPGVLEQFDNIILALKVLVSIKLAQTIRAFSANFVQLGATTTAVRRQMVLFNHAVARLSPAMGVAISSATRLGVALRGLRTVLSVTAIAARRLFAAFGGPIGIAVTALAFFATDAIGGAITATDGLNRVLADNQEILDRVGAAYVRAGDDVNTFRKSLEAVSKVQLEKNIRDLRGALTELRRGGSGRGGEVGGLKSAILWRPLREAAQSAEARAALEKFKEATEAFTRGETGAKDYRDALNDLRAAFGDINDETLDLLAAVDKHLARTIETETALGKAEAAMRVMEGTATEADEALLGLTKATEDAAEAAGDAVALYGKFDTALRELAKSVPSLNAELERFDALAKIEENLKGALAAARNLPEEVMRVAAAQEALQTANLARANVYAGQLPAGFSTAKGGLEAARALIMDLEGFREAPYWDVNAYRAGFGSDTVTLADGSIKKITQGMRVSREDALRDLDRRITTEFMPLAQAAAGDRWGQFTPQQQAALTSIAYNYGNIPARIADEVRSGTADQIAEAIRGLAGDNNGINAGRRQKEAAVFATGVGDEAALSRAQERLDAQKEFNEGLRQQISDTEFLNSLEGKRLIDAEVAKALRDAEREAAKAGVELTKEQRAEIERVTRAKYASQQADEDRNAALEKARALEEEVNRLQERRSFLQEQLQYYSEQGDSANVARTESELEQVNGQLEDAIQKAKAFWQAIGGKEAAGALQTLEQTQAVLARVDKKLVITGQQANEMIGNLAAGAFDRFAQRVAAGENALTVLRDEFLRFAAEFLIEIGKMIIKQALLNALQGGRGGAGGGIGGVIAGAVNSLFHGGGLAGGASLTRTVDPRVFANAVRYHGGGIAGLRPDEVPAILQRNEEILTESDPRHRFNGGLGGGASEPTIINAFDAPGFLDAALSTDAGKRKILNLVRANRGDFKAALG